MASRKLYTIGWLQHSVSIYMLKIIEDCPYDFDGGWITFKKALFFKIIAETNIWHSWSKI